MLISERITILIAFWIIFILLITGDVEIEIFFVLVLIGLIVIKAFADRFTPVYIKLKVNVFIFALTVIFFILVGIKIMDIWSNLS